MLSQCTWDRMLKEIKDLRAERYWGAKNRTWSSSITLILVMLLVGVCQYCSCTAMLSQDAGILKMSTITTQVNVKNEEYFDAK